MVVSNLQAIGFNLIFNNLASTTKYLVCTLLPKMVELNINIVMWRKRVLLSFFTPMFLLSIGLMLSAQPPTLSTSCLCLFLVVFHLLKFYLVSLLIMLIFIPLAIKFTHVYLITHLINFLLVAYRVFFLVIVPHIKASVVLTLQPFARILHGMLDLMRIFFHFQILPVLLLFML